MYTLTDCVEVRKAVKPPCVFGQGSGYYCRNASIFAHDVVKQEKKSAKGENGVQMV